MISIKQSNQNADGIGFTDDMRMDRRSSKRYTAGRNVSCIINQYNRTVSKVINVSLNGLTVQCANYDLAFDLTTFTVDLFTPENGYFVKNVLCKKTFDKKKTCIDLFRCIPLVSMGIQFLNLTVCQLNRIENFKRQISTGLSKDRRSGFDRRFSEERREPFRCNFYFSDRRFMDDRRGKEERRRHTFGVKIAFSQN